MQGVLRPDEYDGYESSLQIGRMAGISFILL